MNSFEVTLTSKGQITIPAELRSKLHLREGDKLEFYFDALRRLVVRPRNAHASAVFDNAPRSYAGAKGMTDDEAIATTVLQKDRRSRARRRVA